MQIQKYSAKLDLVIEKSNCKIYIDELFFGKLNNKIVKYFNLQNQHEISYKKILILETILKKQCLKKALQILTRRDHSSYELKNKLAEFANLEIVNQTLAKLSRLNYVDDFKFAQNFAKKLFTKKYLGKPRVLFELKLKGINPEIAKTAVDSLNLNLIELLLKNLNKKYSNKINSPGNIKKIVKSLIQKGHNYEDIKKSIELFRINFECERKG